jgi:hypothetical protein
MDLNHDEINRQMQLKCPYAHVREWVKYGLESWRGEQYSKLRFLTEAALVSNNWGPLTNFVLGR